jgi:hypothetical protein
MPIAVDNGIPGTNDHVILELPRRGERESAITNRVQFLISSDEESALIIKIDWRRRLSCTVQAIDCRKMPEQERET